MSSPADDHPTKGELHAFLNGLIDSGRAAALSDHVQQCDLCASVIERLDKARDGNPTRDIEFDLLGERLTVVSQESPPATSSDVPLASMLRPGLSVGDYRLEEFLGEGGNGVVFRAAQLKPVRRTVAIKFAKLVSRQDGRPSRATLEQHALASLRHPSIPHFYDAGLTEHGIHYLVMELVEGVPLGTVAKTVSLSVDDTIRLVRCICDAIEYAHRNGVIHRDLKPSNILIQRDEHTSELDFERVKVIDFGIAKIFADGRSSWTKSHELIGTLEYMSPEQLAVPARCDTRSDVRAIGVVLYELLTGRLPFPAAELVKLPLDQAIQRLRCDDPPPPSRAVTESIKDESISSLPMADADITARARQLRGEPDCIVMKAIDRDPERRYQSVATLADDLDRYQRGEVIHAVAPSTLRRAKKWALRHQVWVVGAVLMLTTLFGTGSLILWLYWDTIEANRILAWRTYVGETQRAQILLDQGHNAIAVGILKSHQDDDDLRRLRGIESRLLWAQSRCPSLVGEIKAFRVQVDDLDVSPDGTQVAALSRRRQEIRIYAIDPSDASLEEEVVLPAEVLRADDPEIDEHWDTVAKPKSLARNDGTAWGHNPHPLISCVRYAPHARMLAIGTFSGSILFWNLDESRMDRVIRCDDTATHRLAFTSDGRWLAATGTTLRLIDLAGDVPTVETLFNQRNTSRLDFSPDDQFLIAVDDDRELHIWDVKARVCVASHSLRATSHHDAEVRDIRFAPDGSSIFYVMSNSGIYRRTWSGKRLGETQLIGGTRHGVTALRFGSSPSQLATTCDGALLQYWDVNRPELRDELVGHSGRIGCLAYCRAHDCFLTGGDDGFVRCYRADTSPTFFRSDSATSCIALRPDGEQLWLGFPDGRIIVRDTATAAIVRRFDAAALGMSNPAPITGMCFFADGETVVILCRDGRIGLWDAKTDQLRWFQSHGIPNRLVIDAELQRACVVCRDGEVIILDRNGKLQRRWAMSDGLSGVRWLAAERQFVSCHRGGSLKFWDENGDIQRVVQTDPDVRTLMIHPTEDLFVGFGALGRLVAIDPSDGSVVREFTGHRGVVDKILVLDGGSRLMSIARDFTTRFWDFHSGEEVLMKDGRGRTCNRLQASADESLLVAVYSDRYVEFLRIGDHAADAD